MNKRQRKKSFKQTLIKVRKLHPQKGDVICFQPNFDYVDLGTMCDFLRVYEDNNIFGDSYEYTRKYREFVKKMNKSRE